MKLKPELRISLQCNPVNTATIRPKKKKLAVLTW